MNKKLFSFVIFFVSILSYAQIEDGVYYIQEVESEGFLSRGADWGTRVTVDHYGLPIEISTNSSTATLRYIDYALSTNKLVGAASDGPYTDITSENKIHWKIIQGNAAGQYYLQNTYNKSYLAAGNSLTDGASFVTTKSKASTFRFLSNEEYEEAIVEELPTHGFYKFDVTKLLVNPSMSTGTNGWTASFTKAVATNYSINEVYEGRGSISQRITGLPKGEYLFTLQGFFRDGTNSACYSYFDDGLRVSNAYIYANEGTCRLSDWASDCSGANSPNNMKQACQSFSDGKYQNLVYCTVGDDGILEVGLVVPHSMSYSWAIWGESTLTYLSETEDYDIDYYIYKSQLKQVIEKLSDIVENKKILPPDLLTEAKSALSLAEAANKTEEMGTALKAVQESYEACKAYRLDVDRSSDPYVSYLFVYFPNNSDENLYYAISEDGFNFTPLNNGTRVMASDTVAIKKGIRDPHILRGEDGAFYMVATDMRSAEGWASNRGIVMYRSTDLVHWQHSTVHFPTRFPDWSAVTRVWAPETIWDPNYVNADGSKGRYMIYYSLLSSDGKLSYDKVFYSYANDDFTDLLTDPEYFYDRGSATIDSDIVYDETDGLYHMIFKNEGAGGICQVTAYSLTPENGETAGSQWSKPSSNLQQTNVAVEGGGLFRLIGSNEWVLMYDCYGSGYYQFCTTSDWENFTLRAQTTTSGAFTPRHGTVLPLTLEETAQILKAFPTNGLNLNCMTGIESTNVNHSTKTAVYNLQGVKLNDNKQIGIRIVDGKKILVK